MFRLTYAYSILIICIIISPLSASSLWKEGTPSPYSKNNTLKPGDILTVQIVEATTALQQAQTNLSRQSELDSEVFSSWERVANIVAETNAKSLRSNNEGALSGGDEYTGKGQTTRKSSLKAVITVMVIREVADGVYEVEGNHLVRVNEEEEKISIKGLVRGNDVTHENTVYSYQIANAEISVEGKGSVSSKQNPGILTRLFGWLF